MKIVEWPQDTTMPDAWDVIKIVGWMDKPTGNGTNTKRWYVLLVQDINES